MTCPNCNKENLCGCKHCKDRRKGTIPRHRSQMMKGDCIKCAYCLKSIHVDAWLDKEYRGRKRKLANEEIPED